MTKYAILALICGIHDPVCSPETAISVTRGPSDVSMFSCGFIGQAMLAPTAIAPRPGIERLRVVCSPWPRLIHRNLARNGAILTEARLAR